MAAVRARRGGRMPPEPPRGKRRRPAPPAYDSMPRLARIKLSGGISGDDVEVTGRSLVLALAGGVLFVGIAIAGAAWLGSSLFDAREAFARSADAVVANAGFEIDEIDIAASPGGPQLSAARVQEIHDLIVPLGRHSILALDPAEVKTRIESLDWVADAKVRRLWPSTLIVEVERREEFAVWEDGEGGRAVIDLNGDRLADENAENFPHLLRVRGEGAGASVRPVLRALEDLPELATRIDYVQRVHDRRWDLHLKSGAVVALPEERAPEAMAQLERLQQQYDLLDRPVTRLDMRAPGRLAVRVHPELEGGPLMMGGA